MTFVLLPLSIFRSEESYTAITRRNHGLSLKRNRGCFLVCSRGVERYGGTWAMTWLTLRVLGTCYTLAPVTEQKLYKMHLLDNLPGPRKCAKSQEPKLTTWSKNWSKNLGPLPITWVNDMDQQPGPTTKASNLSQQYVPLCQPYPLKLGQ